MTTIKTKTKFIIKLVLTISIFYCFGCKEKETDKINYEYSDISQIYTDSIVLTNNIIMGNESSVIYTDTTQIIFSDPQSGNVLYINIAEEKIEKNFNFYKIIDLEKEGITQGYATCYRANTDTFILSFDDYFIYKVNPETKSYKKEALKFQSNMKYQFFYSMTRNCTYTDFFFAGAFSEKGKFISKTNKNGETFIIGEELPLPYSDDFIYPDLDYPEISYNNKYFVVYYRYSFLIKCFDALTMELIKEINIKPRFVQVSDKLTHPYKKNQAEYDKIRKYMEENYPTTAVVNLDDDILYLSYFSTDYKSYLLSYNLKNNKYRFDSDKIPFRIVYSIKNDQMNSFYFDEERLVFYFSRLKLIKTE